MAHPGGRPLLFKSVQELEERINAFFADCDPHPELEVYYEFHEIEEVNEKGEKYLTIDTSREPMRKTRWVVTKQKPYTVTALANFLNTSRHTLINYEEKGEFFNTIKRAKDKCEEYWESTLLGNQVAGTIFNLKNNFGWVDRSEVDNNQRFPDGIPMPTEELPENKKVLDKLKENNAGHKQVSDNSR